MLFLTVEQHQEVLRRLVDLGKRPTNETPSHSAGFEYTSLMVCFLLHNLSAAETLLRVLSTFGNDWFPVTVGYAITRTMFEADVTAHYITKAPAERASRYIDFGAVLNKREMDACKEHCNSRNAQWREAMSFLWQQYWAVRERGVSKRFNAVASQFVRVSKGKNTLVSRNWSGRTLRQMAAEVDHLEAYDVFYAELSSFAHVDVNLADRFLRHRPDGFAWSQRANEFDVGNVFRHAASFLTCYLELFGGQFGTWTDTEVQDCWMVKTPGKLEGTAGGAS